MCTNVLFHSCRIMRGAFSTGLMVLISLTLGTSFFDQWWRGRNTRECFKQVPPPPNPPPMTEEKTQATDRRLERLGVIVEIVL
jgi:hypothetical protein